MSPLTPLYLLGLLAVSAPLIFHLIRRSPKGEVWFSSLMFLSPSPPRLTRRSRLDNLLLLLLRAAALCLLAFAFARPFIRTAAAVDRESSAQRRIAVLLDTSASMRRSGIWQRALDEVSAVIDSARPGDEIALFAFDSSLRTVLGFKELVQLPPEQHAAVIRQRLASQSPTWGATNLDNALIDVVSSVNDTVDSSEESAHRLRRVVLISDLQVGSRLDELGAYEWPRDVDLELKTIVGDEANAGLQLLADPQEFAEADAEPEMRIRVGNDPGSPNERFLLRWVDADEDARESRQQSANGDAELNPPVEVYVPPGESRVIRVPYPPEFLASPTLQLTGDRHDFDNTLYVAAKEKEEFEVYYLGPDAAEDITGLQYFLASAFYDTPRRSVQVVAKSLNEELDWPAENPPRLVVVSAETTPANQEKLRQYANAGGTVVFVLTKAGESATLAKLAGVPKAESFPGAVGDYALMTNITFDHPLFMALASPQFNDFTKIHFWQYREFDAEQLQLAAGEPSDNATDDSAAADTVRVVSKFDTGDPAIIEKRIGDGYLIVFTAGWHPADSQLARSTKFVPIVAAMLDRGGSAEIDSATYVVSQRVPLPVADEDLDWSVVTPAGDELAIASEESHFAQADAPGMYKFQATNPTQGVAAQRIFAVNLDPAESRTAVLPVETLEQLRVRVANREVDDGDLERRRQMRDVELESEQKIWRWLVLAAVIVLVAETWLAGRKSTTVSAADEEN